MSATIYIPSLYPLQQKILQKAAPYRFTVLCCGRRFGKTSMMTWICSQAIFGKRIILFAPSPAGFMDTWREVVETVGAIAISVDKVLRNIYFANGGFIKMRSVYSITEADKTRGQFVDYAIYEETQSFPSDVLKYHWENVMYPTLVDLEGSAFFIGTPPNSKMHFFARLYCLGALNNANAIAPDVPMDLHITKEDRSKKSSYIAFRKTAYDNPFIKDRVLDQAKNDNPFMVFQQEYLAQFVDYNMTAWLMCFDEKGELESRVFRPTPPDNRLPFYISFDFNLSPMAATIWQKDDRNLSISCVAEFGSKRGEKVSIQYTTDLIKAWFIQHYGIDISKGYLPPSLQIYITGDATGAQADPRARKGMSFYELIEQELNTTAWGRRGIYKVPKSNPHHKDSWQQMNSWLHQHPNISVDINCQRLRNDMKMTASGAEHEINKKIYDPHFLDTARYFFWNFLPPSYKRL
jgi:hypothetical protein